MQQSQLIPVMLILVSWGQQSMITKWKQRQVVMKLVVMRLMVLRLFMSTFRLAMPAKAKQLVTTLFSVTSVLMMTVTAGTIVSSPYVTIVLMMTMTAGTSVTSIFLYVKIAITMMMNAWKSVSTVTTTTTTETPQQNGLDCLLDTKLT